MIRIATVDDAGKLLEIYRPYIENTAITFEYEVPSVEEFRGRIERTLKTYPYLVLEDASGDICGYAYASAFKSRAAYDWSIETTVYIRTDRHGMGYGRQLYAALERCLILQNVKNANACIAYAHPENTHLDNSSVFFHEKLGYTMVGTFHKCGYKFDEWYDMVWMEKMLGQHTVPTTPFIPFSCLRREDILPL